MDYFTDFPVRFMQTPEGIAVGLSLLLFILLSLMYFYSYSYPAFGKRKEKDTPGPFVPASVIVCVKNEYDNLLSLLPALLAQDYPQYEVIVVDLDSEDDTEILLASLSFKHSNLIHRKISENINFGINKSIQMGVGIKAARYRHLLFISPECLPQNRHWLKNMMASYSDPKVGLVMGHTRYGNASKFLRCDFLQRSMHYMGAARHGRIYSGNGYNFSFTKDLFFDNRGFNPRLSRRHNAEQVLMGMIGRKSRCAACLSTEGTTDFRDKIRGETWKWLRLREFDSIRLNLGHRYFPMLMENLLRLLFFASLITAALLLPPGPPFYLLSGFLCLLLLLRMLMVGIFYRGASRRLGDTGLGFYYLLWDFFAPFVSLFLSLSYSFKNKRP